MENSNEAYHSEHPKVLENENPEVLKNGFSMVGDFMQSYGWVFVLIAVLYLVFKDRLNQQFTNAQRKVENMRENASFDPETAHTRQLAMDEARRRLQERHDQDAARYAEKQKQKDEEKRKEKIEDWDRHLEGKGYRSKIKTNEETASGASGSGSKPVKKSNLRNRDFNPLMGGGHDAGFRPARRMGGGSRGG